MVKSSEKNDNILDADTKDNETKHLGDAKVTNSQIKFESLKTEIDIEDGFPGQKTEALEKGINDENDHQNLLMLKSEYPYEVKSESDEYRHEKLHVKDVSVSLDLDSSQTTPDSNLEVQDNLNKNHNSNQKNVNQQSSEVSTPDTNSHTSEDLGNGRAHQTQTHSLTSTVHKPSKKTFLCEICSKLFVNKRHFLTHQIVHSGEKPYKCTICTKSFSSTEYLNSH